jgi:hypothetical protein
VSGRSQRARTSSIQAPPRLPLRAAGPGRTGRPAAAPAPSARCGARCGRTHAGCHTGACRADAHFEQRLDDLEQAGQHLGRGEVLLDLLLAEGVARFLELFADVGPVPGLRVGQAQLLAAKARRSARSRSANGRARWARSRRKRSPAAGDSAILGTSDTSPKLRSPAAGFFLAQARISRISCGVVELAAGLRPGRWRG